jgi:hypothetical protein
MHDKTTDFSFMQNSLASYEQSFITKFRTIIRFYALFHIAFFVLGFLQILSLILFFSFLMQSSWAAIALASLVLTAFSYLVLHFYFQAKKPQQLLEITFQLEKDLKGEQISKKALCASFLQLSEALAPTCKQMYPLFQDFANLKRLCVKLGIWLHWKDVLAMQELLIFSSINHSVALVKESPLSIDAHQCLASAYTSLAKIYQDPSLISGNQKLPWQPKEYTSMQMQTKLHTACDRAIEELKIIDAYKPADIETHKRLAELYSLKADKIKQIQELETLTAIDPHNLLLLHDLGILYFEKAMNFQAMKIYESLKAHNVALAEDLISHYDATETQNINLQSLSDNF